MNNQFKSSTLINWIVGVALVTAVYFLLSYGSVPSDSKVNQSNKSQIDSSNDVEQDIDNYPTFRGYQCTIDCSGHEAGYDWAEENGITDPDDCSGNSNSFIEGCQSYAEEYQDYYDEY